MDDHTLHVHMLGKLSLSLGSVRIEESGNRSGKLWLLLAYLICNRDRSVSQDALAECLWGRDAEEHRGALKTIVWRARQLLRTLSGEREFILCREGRYRWAPDLPTEVDAEIFETLCRTDESAADRQDTLLRALALYQGDFLEQFSSEPWVEPLSAYYSNLYVHSVDEILRLLPRETCAPKLAELCRAALRVAPYHERFYQELMRCLLQMGEPQKAADVYEEMRQVLMTLGVTPSLEAQTIFTELQMQLHTPILTTELMRDQLTERDPAPGALFCDYSIFKLFYQSEARSAARRGDAVHVGLLSAAVPEGKSVSQVTLEHMMEQLRLSIQGGLRRGDIVSQCSASQFAVLLLQANYENSVLVCRRLAERFAKANPHAPICVRSAVIPLEPVETVAESTSPSERFHGWGI